MNKPMTIECQIDFGHKRRVDDQVDSDGAENRARKAGRPPRVAKFMALALRFDKLVRDGVVSDFAAIARLGHVTRARMSQIMSLLHLAPDIQEGLLFFSGVQRGKDPIVLRDVLPLTQEIDWRRQRRSWGNLVRKINTTASGADADQDPDGRE